jgi:hypothetical protein
VALVIGKESKMSDGNSEDKARNMMRTEEHRRFRRQRRLMYRASTLTGDQSAFTGF